MVAELTETQKEALQQLVSQQGGAEAQRLCLEYLSGLNRAPSAPESIDELLLQLLSGRTMEETVVEQCFRHFSGSLFREYTVLRITSEQSDFDYHPVLHELSVLENYWCVLYDGGIVCLNAHNTPVQDPGRIIRLLHRYGMTAGGSRPFTALSCFREFYLQALDTVSTALVLQHYGSFAQYDDFLMIRLFEQMPEEINLDFFALPDTVILQDYDRTHNTELCRTMLCYLQHSKNVAGTAAELNIHRNTVHYRIGKCSELLKNLNFENDYIAFLLMLSLHIAEYNYYRQLKKLSNQKAVRENVEE